MNHGLKVSGNVLEITLPDGIDIEKVVVNGQEYISCSDHDIQTMQDLESAQIDKAYELGAESKKGEQDD